VRGNLYVVSRLGQVRNVQTFIRDFGATENHLAVLYTDANTVLSDNIDKNIERGLFDEVVFVRQPERPLAQGRTKNRIIYTQIEDLLLKMAEKGVEHLYLCNVDNYYSFFERVIADKNLPISIGLLEEGLGTYSFAGHRNYAQDTRTEWSDVRHRARNFGRALWHATKALVILIATFFSWVFRADLYELARSAMTALTVEKRFRYGSITHFDTAHVYFPERVRSGDIKIDHIEGLDFVVEPTAPPEALAAIEDGAAVFVSQKYIAPDEYFEIIFDILSEMGVEKVYFKFHPRENKSALASAWDNALERHPRLKVLCPDEIQSIPVEELMMAGKVKQVIGLTSTSLMYGQAFFSGIDVVSIGARFRQLAESDSYDVPKRVLAEFNRDLDVFLEVSGVRQF
jgi:hypothetical protein